MTNIKFFRTVQVLLALAGLTLLCPGISQAVVTCETTPSLIPITMGYHGMPVEIRGESAPGDDVIVKITSAPADAHLKYKGKAAGMVWMKLGTLIYKNIPGTYLVASTSPLDKALSQEARDENSIGYEALQKKVVIEAEHGGALPAGDWFTQFIDFKKHEQVYALHEGDVHVNANGGYTLSLNWPYQAQPGKYTVEVITAKDGQVTGKAEQAITVEMTGIVGKISELASHNRAMYGIISIVVALAAGFAVGSIFKKGGGAH